MTQERTLVVFPKRLSRLSGGLWIFGAFLLGLGIFVDPHRVFPLCLQAAWFLTLAGLFGVFFIAVNEVTRGVWFAPIRRTAEALAAMMPFAGIAMALVLIGIHFIYEWAHVEVVANDPVLQEKTGWLNVPFFLFRAVVYYALWIFFSRKILGLCRKWDESGDFAVRDKLRAWSAVFLIVMALSLSLASFDFILSLEPHWFSTIFGVYNFARMFQSGICFLIVTCLLLRRLGVFQNIFTPDRQHNLGIYLFAFSIFWMYIWFSQYMLIWYSHIPEETFWYVHRHHTSWGAVSIANIVLNWGLPFFALLSIPSKKKTFILLPVALFVLVGHWVDLTFLVQPTFHKEGVVFGVFEFSAFVFSYAFLFWIWMRGFARRPAVPAKDPWVEEALHSHG